jgi:hypothetical protein
MLKNIVFVVFELNGRLFVFRKCIISEKNPFMRRSQALTFITCVIIEFMYVFLMFFEYSLDFFVRRDLFDD